MFLKYWVLRQSCKTFSLTAQVVKVYTAKLLLVYIYISWCTYLNIRGVLGKFRTRLKGLNLVCLWLKSTIYCIWTSLLIINILMISLKAQNNTKLMFYQIYYWTWDLPRIQRGCLQRFNCEKPGINFNLFKNKARQK